MAIHRSNIAGGQEDSGVLVDDDGRAGNGVAGGVVGAAAGWVRSLST